MRPRCGKLRHVNGGVVAYLLFRDFGNADTELHKSLQETLG